jgi:hypothetical protein
MSELDCVALTAWDFPPVVDRFVFATEVTSARATASDLECVDRFAAPFSEFRQTTKTAGD